MRAGAALFALCALPGCITVADREPPAPQQVRYYTVLPGDTLSGIAFRLGLDWRDIARWNDLDSPSLIHPGQRLRVVPPAGRGSARAGADTRATGGSSSAPASRAPTGRAAPVREVDVAADGGAGASGGARRAWRWPGSGRLVARFGDPASVGRGIDIGGREGDEVVAAADGRVVYTGSGLIGYGNLVIIKHDDVYLSAYGHNSSLLVDQGQDVSAGERIALMGLGPGREPLLHFEIRRNGKPVDPLDYLPARSSGAGGGP